MADFDDDETWALFDCDAAVQQHATAGGPTAAARPPLSAPAVGMKRGHDALWPPEQPHGARPPPHGGGFPNYGTPTAEGVHARAPLRPQANAAQQLPRGGYGGGQPQCAPVQHAPPRQGLPLQQRGGGMMQDPSSFQLARVPLSASPPDSPSGGPLAAPANLPDVPSSALFNQIQRTALEVLSPNDYHSVGGKRFIKKSGWRRLAMFFGISLEIRNNNETLDPNGNVMRCTMVVRGIMASGRYSDAFGSCDRAEKRFQAPNRDIPATAETRASSRAIQNLLGISD